MKASFILFLTFSVICTGPVYAQKTKSPTLQPKLTVDTPEIELGDLYAGDVRTTRVTLKNVGGDTLKIGMISTSCGCTTVKQPKPFLLKNQKDVLEVNFNSTNFRGVVAKKVYINTNDPHAPVTTVTLRANIKNELEVIAPRLPIGLGAISWQKAVLIPLTLKNRGSGVISITGVDDPSGRITLLGGGRKFASQDTGTVVVSFFPKKEGFLNEHILLKTDSRVQNRIPVRVFYTVVAPEKTESTNTTKHE